MSQRDYYLLYCGRLQYHYLESFEFYHFSECVFLTPQGNKFQDFFSSKTHYLRRVPIFLTCRRQYLLLYPGNFKNYFGS